MTKQEKIAVSFAITKVVMALADEYKLPSDEVVEIAMEAFKSGMEEGLKLDRETTEDIIRNH